MALGTLVVMAVLVAAILALPWWPYSRRWGYAPSGVLAVALAVLAGLILLSRSAG